MIENRDAVVAGTILTGRHKKQDFTCKVVQTDEGLRYVLEDGVQHKSPSAAGSSVLGGTACNGWRFWSVAGTEKPKREPKLKAEKVAKASKPKAAKPAAAKKRAKPQSPRATTSERQTKKAARATREAAMPFECGECGERFETTAKASTHAAEVHVAA